MLTRAFVPIVARLAALTIVVIGLAACGPALDARYVTAAAAPRSTPGAVQAAPSATVVAPTPAPVVATPAGAPTLAAPVAIPTAAPVATPVPAPAPPRIRRGSFALIPFGSRGASGTVSVTADGMGFAISVNALGLAPGSAHAVHLHAGSCMAAFAGRHLLIIGTMVGNGMGGGALSSRVGLSYSAGRYVIVYANLSPATIIGCADLGAM